MMKLEHLFIPAVGTFVGCPLSSSPRPVPSLAESVCPIMNVIPSVLVDRG